MAWRGRRGADGQESTASAFAKADALYERAIRLSHQPGSTHAAERVAGEAVAAYRALQRPSGRTALQARRRLALALGRHSLLLAANHGAAVGLEPGREGVALARTVLATADPDDPEFDTLIAETATAMSDLSQTTAAAAHAMQSDIARGRHSEHQAASVLDALDKVVEVRRALLDADSPATHVELASSLLHRGRLRCLLADGEGGTADLLAAWDTLATVEEPGIGPLGRQLRHAMQLAEQAYPHVVAALAWPLASGAGDGTAADSARADDSAGWKPAMAEALRLMDRGERRQAVAVLTPVAKAGAHQAMHTLALLFGEMGQKRRAGRWLAKAAHAGNSAAMVLLGRHAAESGRLDEALPLWERAAELGHPQAMINLAVVLHAIGRTDEAARWHRQGLAAQRT